MQENKKNIKIEHFYINGFALSLVLKQTLKTTRRWPNIWKGNVLKKDVQYPAEGNANVLVNQHGRRDVRCKEIYKNQMKIFAIINASFTAVKKINRRCKSFVYN